MSSILRQWKILRTLDRNRSNGVRKQELVDRFEVSERTIENDINTLTDAGFLIIRETDGKERRFKFHERSSFRFSAADLTDLENRALLFAKEALSDFRQFSFYPDLERAIEKIIAHVSDQKIENWKDEIDHFDFTSLTLNRWLGYYLHYLRDAEIAIRDRKQIWINYASVNRWEITERKVNPYGIYESDGKLRVVGYCHLREGSREFCFDGRMHQLTILDETFDRDAKFDFENYKRERFRGFGGEKIDLYVIRVGPPISRWAKHQQWNGLIDLRELDDEIIELRIETAGREGVKRQVLEWGACATVISPADFREAIRDELKCAIDRY